MDYKLFFNIERDILTEHPSIKLSDDDLNLIEEIINYIASNTINEYNRRELILMASSILIIARVTDKRTDEILKELNNIF